jgi:hypothetical protein
VSPKFRFVAVAPERREEHKEMGKAVALHDFLVDHQTDAAGNVNYGKPVSYTWIRSKWRNSPPERTLKRHMARLKACGLALVQRLPHSLGMRVRVLRSAKWAPEAAQLRLFPLPDVLSINRGKDAEKLLKECEFPPVSGAKSGTAAVPKVALKSSKNLREEKNNSRSARSARSSQAEDAAALAERRRLLADQSRFIQQKFKSSC